MIKVVISSMLSLTRDKKFADKNFANKSRWRNWREFSLRENFWLYGIPGNFRMVQIFAVFADRSATTKIRSTKFSSLSSANYGLLVGVVLQER